MKNAFRWSLVLSFTIMIMLLSACGAQGNQTPTTDPSTVFTTVAKTVQAQITSNAKLTTTVTATPKPTETPGAANTTLRPSSTPFGTGTAAVNLTPQKGVTVVANPLASATISAAATQSPGASSADKMQYVSQKVADGSTFSQGQAFTMTWVIKNIGSTTWDKSYLVRLFAGDRFGAADLKFSGTVKPGEQTNVTLDMTAPNTMGEYNSVWVMTNTDGRNFGSFTLSIKVK